MKTQDLEISLQIMCLIQDLIPGSTNTYKVLSNPGNKKTDNTVNPDAKTDTETSPKVKIANKNAKES